MANHDKIVEINVAKRGHTAMAFKEKAQQLLGDNYDLTETIYGKNNKEKVKIKCLTHGDYWMTPANVVSGQKCPSCARKSQANSHRDSKDSFIEKARAVHGDVYDYTEVDYRTSHTKVLISCPQHGDFKMTPNCHVCGQGCPSCGAAKCGLSRSQNRGLRFKADVSAVHGDKYLLHKTEYMGKGSKVLVTCRSHGDFTILPHVLLNGSGCRACANNGYRTNMPGTLYVLTSGDLTKVGITNKQPQSRARRVSKSSGEDFSVVAEFEFADGGIPFDIEDVLLTQMSMIYEQPSHRFEGFTECFYNVDIPELLSCIEQLIAGHSASTNEQDSSTI